MEDTSLYRPILKESFRLVKKFKHLWFFGLFAAILGAGGEYEILYRAVTSPNSDEGMIASLLNGWQTGIQDGLIFGGNLLGNLFVAVTVNPLVILLIAIMFIITMAIFGFFVWLTVVSQIGLIKNASLVASNKPTQINEGIDYGVKYFWPVLAINAILKIILFILFFILGAEIIIFSQYGMVGNILYYLSFIVFIVIIFIVSFILRYQIYYLILKRETFKQALTSAYNLFKQNWLISLELAFILFLVYLFSTFITTFIIAVFLAIPFVIVFYLQGAAWVATIITIIGLIVMITLVLSIISMVMAYQWTAWTLLFNKLTEKVIPDSRINRTSKQVTNYFAK